MDKNEVNKTEQKVTITLKDLELLRKDLRLWTLGMMLSGFVLFASFITFLDNRTQARLDRMENSIDARLNRMENSMDARLNRMEQAFNARFQLIEADIKTIEADIKIIETDIKTLLLASSPSSVKKKKQRAPSSRKTPQ